MYNRQTASNMYKPSLTGNTMNNPDPSYNMDSNSFSRNRSDWSQSGRSSYGMGHEQVTPYPRHVNMENRSSHTAINHQIPHVGKMNKPLFMKNPQYNTGSELNPSFKGNRQHPSSMHTTQNPSLINDKAHPSFMAKKQIPPLMGYDQNLSSMGKMQNPSVMGYQQKTSFMARKHNPSFIGNQSNSYMGTKMNQSGNNYSPHFSGNSTCDNPSQWQQTKRQSTVSEPYIPNDVRPAGFSATYQDNITYNDLEDNMDDAEDDNVDHSNDRLYIYGPFGPKMRDRLAMADEYSTPACRDLHISFINAEKLNLKPYWITRDHIWAKFHRFGNILVSLKRVSVVFKLLM